MYHLSFPFKRILNFFTNSQLKRAKEVSQSLGQAEKTLGETFLSALNFLSVNEMAVTVSKLLPSHIMISVDKHLQGDLFIPVT